MVGATAAMLLVVIIHCFRIAHHHDTDRHENIF